jgi:DNA-binding winged helix-turn-helix (wHTH) protein
MFAFDRFVLDPADRMLRRDDQPVELSSRYLDALALLVSEQGRLVSKERFFGEVWRGIPVTDEALTQCIRTLRKELGDDASRPRFIETVPKHGYRFIGPVERVQDVPSSSRQGAQSPSSGHALLVGAAGTLGGGLSGVIGGLIYGFAGASQPLQPGMGAVSVLLVLLCLTILVALMGGAGVAFGIAAAGSWSRPLGRWSIAGGALGGLLVGAVVKLLGIDAFSLLIGRSPGNITGAMEGLVIGAAVGLGASLGARSSHIRRGSVLAGLCGAAAGAIIPLLGGRLMAGSLDLLAHSMPGSRLKLDHFGTLLGENGLGPITQSVTGALEGGLFASCVVTAMLIARRNLSEARRRSAGDSSRAASGAPAAH